MLVAEWKPLPTSKETSFQGEKGQKVQTRSPIEKSFSPQKSTRKLRTA